MNGHCLGKDVHVPPIMFHHFHEEVPYAEGSITGQELEQLIHFIGKHRILDARDFLQRLENGTLESHHTCITLDDGLASQYKVALPVLTKYNIKAFWNCYTCVFDNQIETLEVCKYFKTRFYKSESEFMQHFLEAVEEVTSRRGAMGDIIHSTAAITHSAHVPFYSLLDRQFRYVRDIVVKDDMCKILKWMTCEKGVTFRNLASQLWMTDKQLRQLHDDGHVIGLHTANHNRSMDIENYQVQMKEYTMNKEKLCEILDCVDIVTMAHPLGKFRRGVTDVVLSKIGIKLGFAATPHVGRSRLEYPRIDHMDMMDMMKCDALGAESCAPSAMLQSLVKLNCIIQHEFGRRATYLSVNKQNITRIMKAQFKDTNGYEGRFFLDFKVAKQHAIASVSKILLASICMDKATMSELSQTLLNRSDGVRDLRCFYFVHDATTSDQDSFRKAIGSRCCETIDMSELERVRSILHTGINHTSIRAEQTRIYFVQHSIEE